MTLASMKNSIISKLVLNDIGAVISGKGLQRLSTYAGKEPTFKSVEESVPHFKKIYQSFGNLNEGLFFQKDCLIQK